MAQRYPDAPPAERGSTVQTGDWFEDYAKDQMEKAWGISPKSYKSAEYQLSVGEGRFCEYKHDPHSKYGHLSIEVQERKQAAGRWVVAGPLRCKQPFYVQGDKEKIWVFPTHSLVQWLERCGVWVNWEAPPDEIVSDVIDENGLVSQPFATLRRVFLDYDVAEHIGGVAIGAQ